MQSKLAIRHLLRTPFDLLAVAVVYLLAWSSAFVYTTWSPDNYSQVFMLHQCRALWAQLGRPLMDVLYCFVFGGQFQPQLQLLLGLACLFVLGLLIAKEWRLGAYERFFFMCFIATFPFLCNVFGFETGKFSIPLAYLLSTCSWLMVRGTAKPVRIVAVLIFSSGILLYQTCVNFLIVLALLSIIFDSSLCGNPRVFRRLIARTLSRLAFLLVPGLILYLVLSEAARFLTRSGYNSRYGWIAGIETPNGLILQIRDILAHYKYFLLPGHPLLPALFGVVALFAATVVAFSCIFQVMAPVSGTSNFHTLSRVQAAAVVVFLPLSCLSVWATDLPISGSLLGDGYRHTYPVVLVFSATLIIFFRIASGFPVCQAVAQLAMGAIIASFVIIDASWAFDSYRLSVFELSVANRLAQKIEASVAEHRILYVVGGLPSTARPLGLQSRGYDVLGSGLDNPGSAAAVFRSIGLKFEAPTASQLPFCERLISQANPVAMSPECNVINLSRL